MEITMSDLIAIISILSSIWLAVYTWYNSNRLKSLEHELGEKTKELEHKLEIERKKIETSLEINKNKALLNDKNSREVFIKFVESYISLLNEKDESKGLSEKQKEKKQKENTDNLRKNIYNMKKLLIVSWSASLIKELNIFQWYTSVENQTTEKLLFHFNNLLKYFRDEIWVDNKNIWKYDLVQIFVNENLGEKFKTNK